MSAVPPKSKRRRRPALLVTLLLLGIVVALLLVELGFRLFWRMPPVFVEFQQAGLYVAGPAGEPMLQPGYRGTLRVFDEGTTTVAVNSLGMRGDEVGPKRAGEKRLLVVGDSLVFGYGVEAPATLSQRLQVALQERGLTVTAGNGGIPGFGASHAVRHMGLLDGPFGADAFVVCGFLGNDASDEAQPKRTVYAGMMLNGAMADLVYTSWRTRLALRSRAALWFEAMVLNEKPQWSPLATWVPSPEDVARLGGMPPEPQRHAGLFLDVIDEQASWPKGGPPVIPRLVGYLREALQKAKEIAGPRPLVFVILPTSWQCDENKRVATLQGMGFDPKDFRRGLAQQRWLAAAKAAGVPAFDATPILVAAGDAKDLYILEGGHLNARGNDVVARWLAGELAALLK